MKKLSAYTDKNNLKYPSKKPKIKIAKIVLVTMTDETTGAWLLKTGVRKNEHCMIQA